MGGVVLCACVAVILCLRRKRNWPQTATGGTDTTGASPVKAELEGSSSRTATSGIQELVERAPEQSAELVAKEPEQRAELPGNYLPYYELDTPASPVSLGPGIERNYLP